MAAYPFMARHPQAPALIQRVDHADIRDLRSPIHFTLIRPFHHLLVWAMARTGAR